jgi:hypothetical protein
METEGSDETRDSLRSSQAAAVVGLLWSTASVGGRQTPALPPRLGEYIKTHVKMTPEEQTQLLEGQ